MDKNARAPIAVRLLLSAALVALCGCSPPFPKELLDGVEKGTSFADLHKDPDRHIGKLVLLGGTIVGLRNAQEGTRLEVLQRPLDSETRPEPTDETGGRFLVLTRQFLDGAVFQPGRAVTVVGETGPPQTLPLGEIEYRYPVVSAKAIHLWQPYQGPRFSIGIGVYRGF